VQFLDALNERTLVGDGAMGTMLYAKGVPLDQPFELVNAQRPELVSEIHRAYIEAGADVIETNTFGANEDRLRRTGHGGRVRELNEAGARLAREAAQGRDVFVAGSIGPLSLASASPGGLDEDVRRAMFVAQAEALAEGGVDLFMLETFTELFNLRIAYEAARSVAPELPVVAQMAFLERTGTLRGEEPIATLTEVWRLGADVVGVNCGRGPRLVLSILEDFAPRTGKPLSAFFNAGSPDLIDGRYMYLEQPPYLADMAVKLVEAGVNLVGGCCGTTPEVVAAIAGRLKNRKPLVRPAVALPPRPRVEEGADPVFPPGFLDKPETEPSVIAELDPPRGLDYEPVLEGAKLLAEVGIDLVSCAENPLASVRMGNVAMSVLMREHAGLEPLAHFTCRDRNLLGLQADIMGAYALGLRNILCITGDPVSSFVGEFEAKGVYDVASFGLVKMVAGLNRGHNASGASIRRPTQLRIGVAFNSNVKHLHVQVARLEKKVALGAHYCLTQPCWDPERIREVFAATEHVGVPVYMGVFPFVSERNAEFLHNEVPGMTVPEELRARMRGLKGERGREEGCRICEELIDVIAEHSNRVYLVTPFNRFEMTARLAEHFKARVRARNAGAV
jgi:homocysteine S-methyltransferase